MEKFVINTFEIKSPKLNGMPLKRMMIRHLLLWCGCLTRGKRYKVITKYGDIIKKKKIKTCWKERKKREIEKGWKGIGAFSSPPSKMCFDKIEAVSEENCWQRFSPR